MKRSFSKTLALLMALFMVITVPGIDPVKVRADELLSGSDMLIATLDTQTVARPKISVKTKGDSIVVTVKPTANAEGYQVYVKAEGAKKYTLDGKIEQDGTAKRSYTVKGLASGSYYVKVKAYNGESFSKASKAKNAVIGTAADTTKSEILLAWNDDAPAKKEIVAYMQAITKEGGKDYIPVERRIAVFDLDGTLYCETDPNYFDHLLLEYHVLKDEDYKDKASAFEKKVANDVVVMNETGVQAENMEVNHGTAIATSFKGYTPDEFYDYIAEFKKTPMNSYDGMTLGEAFYVPMLQIVEYLEANDFTVYIVSGTDRFIVRGLIKDSKLDIPFNQIIGSDETLVATNQGDTDGLKYTYTDNDELVFGGEFIIKNLKTNKVTVIAQEIGMQPVLSFGNSTGDSSMAEYVTTNNKYKSLAFMLCCDDTERENGKPKKAEDMVALCEKYDWVPVSMKNDWKTIYGEGVRKK
ncbi:MAG: haloacid dehalogenase-like hydrolase [Lachnospiraceae bacterium]|nr:haloacid dehalogenase-like hydrolase [Lachnospiraceae bacterium]